RPPGTSRWDNMGALFEPGLVDGVTSASDPETMQRSKKPRGPPMPKIDDARPFIPVRIGVLTVSDTRGPTDDRSGDALVRLLAEAGHQLAARARVKDEVLAIRAAVESWIADPAIDVVITTGGTGFTGRDVTPEAVRPLFEKEIDGFAIVFHIISLQKVGTS